MQIQSFLVIIKSVINESFVKFVQASSFVIFFGACSDSVDISRKSESF